MNKDYSNIILDVKDLFDVTVAPSVGQCEYKRGVCLKHNTRGQKYVEVSKRWKDRGKGFRLVS